MAHSSHTTDLVKYEVFPLLASEGVMVLNHELVRRDAHVECIGFGPALHGLFTTHTDVYLGRNTVSSNSTESLTKDITIL